MSSRDFKLTFDVETRAFFWLALISLLVSVQLVALMALIFSFIPYKPDAIVYKIFPLFLDQIRPERELLFFTVFIVCAIVIQAAFLFLFRRHVPDESWVAKLRVFAFCELALVFLIAFAAFKIFVYGNPLWARILLWSALGMSVAVKVFWPESKKIAAWAADRLAARQHSVKLRRIWDAGVVAFIVFVIFLPDPQAVLARIYVWDQFYHIDMFIMSSTLAYIKGNILNVDVISLYSVFLSVILGNIMKWMGGLSYERLLNIFMVMTIVYYGLCYAILRTWTRSLVLATFAILLMIKLQMFHTGILPIVWRYPSTTVMRHLFDLLTIWAVLRHTQTQRPVYLYAAAAGCGLMIAYTIDVGINLTLGLYAYLIMLVLIPHCRRIFFVSAKDWAQLAAWCLIPFASAFVLFLAVQGPSILSQTFWTGYADFISIFLNGWGSLPMTDGLKEKQFFAFCMGFVIPVVYVWTLIVTGALCYLNKIRWQNLFIIFMTVYGLAAYHYFMGRSATTSYYVVVVPCIFVVCFWLGEIRNLIPQKYKMLTNAFLVVSMTGSLLTSYLVTYYPNVLNLAGFDFTPEKKIYQAQFDFSKDAELISKLTAPTERVAILSSFETAILIEADRGPFFYYFPMINSVAMGLNDFRATEMYSHPRMKKTLDQLEGSKPEYIFVEKRLIKRQLSPAIFEHFETLRVLLDYVDKNYTAQEEGQYLVAMKRVVGVN